MLQPHTCMASILPPFFEQIKNMWIRLNSIVVYDFMGSNPCCQEEQKAVIGFLQLWLECWGIQKS